MEVTKCQKENHVVKVECAQAVTVVFASAPKI